MPKMKVDKYGRPHQAPYGMRKIEAALLDAGISAAIIDPDHVHKYIPALGFSCSVTMITSDLTHHHLPGQPL